MMNLNWYYCVSIAIIACGGIPKGYDEGGFSASITSKSFEKDFNLLPSNWTHNASGLASRNANITSTAILGAAFGAFISLKLADRFGRLRCWQLFVLTWACGLFMMIFSSGIFGLLIFSRVVSGIGAGGLTVVGPLYLAEIAPAKSRGMVVGVFMVFLLTFLTLGFFVNYGASRGIAPSRTQYRLVQAVPLIPVGLAFIASFFLTETPRWLASEGRTEEAITALHRIRKSRPATTEDRITEEYNEILRQCQAKEQQLKEVATWDIIKEVVTIPRYRERLLLGLTMQLVAQWSGGNGITYYIPQIFVYAGVTGSNTSLITSGAYGCVKIVFTMLFTWVLVDRVGRRFAFIAGLSLQLIAHIYMAIYMAIFRPPTLSSTNAAKQDVNKSASDAAIAMVFVYAVGWSIGLCTLPYIYTNEIYPTRHRGFCYSVSMAVHWLSQFGLVRALPNMFVTLRVYGVYVFFSGVCGAGLVILGVWAPETRKVPMERMEELFKPNKSWYTRGMVKLDLSLPVDGSNGKLADTPSGSRSDEKPYALQERVERA